MKSLRFIGIAAMIVAMSNPVEANLALQVGYGHLSARALHAACYFKLFDPLESGPKSAEQLAASAKLQSDPVKRVMRVIANHDLVNMDASGRFSLNENSKRLVSRAPGSLQPAFAKEFDLKRWAALGNLQIALEKGEVPFDVIFGKSFYGYLEADPKAAALFNDGMKSFSQTEDAQVATRFNFDKYDHYCDVGGGTGGLVKHIIASAPKIKATLFDLPSALVDVKVPGVELASGSFFDAVPSAQVYTVKRVLHNWDDKNAVKILENVKKGLSDHKKGRVLVIEKVLPKMIDHSLLLDSEIISLALGGQERTLDEFVAIGRKAGLELEQHIALDSVSMMVFKKGNV